MRRYSAFANARSLSIEHAKSRHRSHHAQQFVRMDDVAATFAMGINNPALAIGVTALQYEHAIHSKVYDLKDKCG